MDKEMIDNEVQTRAALQLSEFERLLRYSLMVVAALFLAVFLPMALARAVYGYDLEWMEGGMVDHVIRILDGKQLYVEPGLDFIPFTYTPLYFYVSAALTAVIGEGYLPLRLVSILSTLGIFLLIFQLVRRETGQWFYGLLSAGLFAAGYVYTGSWYDLARTDSMFILLILAGVYLLRFSERWAYLVLAGVFFWLSFMTKQTALIVAVAMAAYCLIYLPGWKKLAFPATVALLTGISTIILNALSNGWYLYYIYQLPQKKGSIPGQVSGFWLSDMHRVYLGLAVSMAFLLFLMVMSRKKEFAFYALFFASMVGASWLVSNYYGSFVNDLIPAFTAVVILFGLGVNAMTSDTGGEGQGRSFSRLLLVDFVLLVCLLQLMVLFYNPLHQLPTKADERAGDALVTLLQQANGEVFVPGAGYVARQAGKQPGAHIVALGDVLNGHDDKADDLEQRYSDAVGAGRYDLVVLNDDFGHDWSVWRETERSSREQTTLVGKVYFSDTSFIPVTGHQDRPDTLFVFTREWDWKEVYSALGFVGDRPPAPNGD